MMTLSRSALLFVAFFSILLMGCCPDPPPPSMHWPDCRNLDDEVMPGAAACAAGIVALADDPTPQLIKVQRTIALGLTKTEPDNGENWYAAAYLTGQLARADSIHGLTLAAEMEMLALKAAEVDPAQNHGGPHRMLGELYRKAPAFPVSIGDLDASLEQYRKASAVAPDYAPNRLGLAAMLLKLGDTNSACHEAAAAMGGVAVDDTENWKRGTLILHEACPGMTKD